MDGEMIFDPKVPGYCVGHLGRKGWYATMIFGKPCKTEKAVTEFSDRYSGELGIEPEFVNIIKWKTKAQAREYYNTCKEFRENESFWEVGDVP